MTAAVPHLSMPSFRGAAGVARRDITPPVGIYSRLWGAATHNVASGIHRPLTLTALALSAETGSDPLLLVAMDGSWWWCGEDERQIREAALEALGLPPSALVVNLSHSHAAAVLSRGAGDNEGGHLLGPYLDHVETALIEAGREALEALGPAVLTWGRGTCDLAVNRDFPDPDRPRYLCGCNPARAADQQVLVGRVTGDDGRIVATIVNYACHPTTLAWENDLISPDYPGAMRETVEQHTDQAPCLFLLGACGELGPAHQYVADPAVADRHGRRLGHAALATLEGMLPPGHDLAYLGALESGAPLALWRPEPQPLDHRLEADRITVELPIRPEYPTAERLRQEYDQCTDHVKKERLRRQMDVRRLIGDKTACPVTIWLWRLGESFLVGCPGEAYSMLQTELRARFPRAAIACLNCANGWAGYFPPAELYGQDLYQVWQTPFASGCLERLLQACTARISQLTGA